MPVLHFGLLYDAVDLLRAHVLLSARQKVSRLGHVPAVPLCVALPLRHPGALAIQHSETLGHVPVLAHYQQMMAALECPPCNVQQIPYIIMGVIRVVKN